MAWFKVDDHLHASRKAAKAGAAAMGLWVLAGSWSAAEELDGFVPAYMVTRLAGADGEDMANALVRAGFWTTGEHDGEDGYQFHAWAEYQPTRAQLEAKREAARDRMRGVRAQGGRVRANSAGTSGEVRSTPTRPDPSLKNTPAAAAAETDPVADEFAAFWTEYPRKTGKAAAAKAYTKARKGAEAEAILAGLRNAIAVWRAARTEPQFIPHPATWLNGGRWEDEHPSLPGAPVAPTGPSRTANQCPESTPHDRHSWDQGRNHFVCLGVSA